MDFAMEPADTATSDTKCVLRLLFPVASIGTVIGKGGETINALREETQTEIRVEDYFPRCDERVIRITACDTSDAKCPSQVALNTLIQKHFEEEGSKYGNVTVRLLVWSAQSGAIIGKSGQGITKLRTVTGADIRILARHETPICASAKDDLVCQIVASKETVSKAVAAVTDIIRAHPVENILQRRVVRSNSADVSIEIALRMLVPISKTGNIIGKGGEVIQKIRAETGSKIQLFQLSEDHEYRVVEFTSTNVPVCAAQEALLRCIYKMNELEPPTKYSARLLVPSQEAGAVLGKGGAKIKPIREKSGAFIRMVDEDEIPECADGDRMFFVEGNPTQVGEAVMLLTDKLIESGVSNASALVGQKARAAQGTKRKIGDADTIVLHIPRNQIGSVIGKAGSNITQIRQISTAAVKVHNADPVTGEHQVEITGSTQDCRAAENLVQAYLAKSGAPYARSGSSTETSIDVEA